MPYLTPESIPVTTRCRTLLIPDDILILAAVNGALYDLALAENWEQYGAVTPSEMAERMMTVLTDYFDSGCSEVSTMGATFLRYFHYDAIPLVGSAIAVTSLSGQYHGGQAWVQSPAAQGDQWGSDSFLLQSGTWRVKTLHATGSNRSIEQLSIRRASDNAVMGSANIDMYSASVVVNVRAQFNVTIPDDGYYYLHGLTNTRHASSLGWAVVFTNIYLLRTGD